MYVPLCRLFYSSCGGLRPLAKTYFVGPFANKVKFQVRFFYQEYYRIWALTINIAILYNTEGRSHAHIIISQNWAIYRFSLQVVMFVSLIVPSWKPCCPVDWSFWSKSVSLMFPTCLTTFRSLELTQTNAKLSKPYRLAVQRHPTVMRLWGSQKQMTKESRVGG